MNDRLESLTRDQLIRLVVRQVGAIDQAKADAAAVRREHVADLEELVASEQKLTAEMRRSARLVRELTRLSRKLTRRTRRPIALEKESRRWQ